MQKKTKLRGVSLLIFLLLVSVGIWLLPIGAKASTTGSDIVLVTIYADDGKFEDKHASHSVEVIKGKELAEALFAPGVVTEIPKYKHHELTGWKVTYETSKKSVDADYELIGIYAKENISLHPIWKELPGAQITFDANGGSFPNGKSTYSSKFYGDSRIILEDNNYPQKKGEVLIGWASKNNLNYPEMQTYKGTKIISYLDFEKFWSMGYIPLADDTLVAQWTKGFYVTIDYNGGTNPNLGPGWSPKYTLNIPSGETIKKNDLPSVPMADSYMASGDFLGWKLLESNDTKLYTTAEVLSYVPTKDVTFCAQFRYTVSNGWVSTGKGYLYLVDGVPAKGWIQEGSKWFYADKEGVVQSGWKKLGGKWYYFGSGFEMTTGWKKIKYNWYLFDKNGVMQTGWKKSGGSWYYLDSSGIMQTGKVTIDGVLYNFAPSGELYEEGEEYRNTGVVINETNFPDPVFRKFISYNSFDTDHNEILSWKEIQTVTSIKIDGTVWTGMKNIKGIEVFRSLKVLNLSGIQTESFSVDGLDTIESLIISSGALKSLSVSNCANLKLLDCSRNKLTSLDLSKVKGLKVLYCEHNSMTKLSILQNPCLCTAYNNKTGAIDEGTSTIYISENGDYQFSVDNNVSVSSRVFSHEWFDGKWYNSDGTQTYGYTLKWKHDSKGWWITDSSGWYPKNQWQKVDGVWYYFKKNGYMAADEWVKGYYFNKDGSWTYTYKGGWHQTEKGWWYGDTSGWYAKNCTCVIDGKKYVFDSRGYLK